MNDDDDYGQTCEICGGDGDPRECDMCHAPGCTECLVQGGEDMYQWLCPECAGLEESEP